MLHRQTLSLIATVLILICFVLCGEEGNSERLSFTANEQNEMIRLQSFVHGRMEPGRNIQTYEFILKQSENMRGVFQIDSVSSDLKLELIKKEFPFDSKTSCANANSGNTFSCKIEIQSLEKGTYRLTVFRATNKKESDFNLFAGIFGKGYIDVDSTSDR
ncbi:LIC_10463 family lipoprotein [Leptospira yasudae]|uniref:LIC_10463 family lipoprotein n=1 Tax=Leptospira yasudae TaxID=2202201 RepID=UPI001FC95CD0|nr:hypothetical protein [Leptospira yasudae]